MLIFFDLYGTLLNVSTDRYSRKSADIYASLLSEEGIKISASLIYEELICVIDRVDHNPTPDFVEKDHLSIFNDFFNNNGFVFDLERLKKLAYLCRVSGRNKIYIDKELHETLKLLRKNNHLGIISNAQYIYTRPEIEMFSLDKEVDDIFLSSEIGYRKPGEEIFLRALLKINKKYDGDIWYVGEI